MMHTHFMDTADGGRSQALWQRVQPALMGAVCFDGLGCMGWAGLGTVVTLMPGLYVSYTLPPPPRRRQLCTCDIISKHAVGHEAHAMCHNYSLASPAPVRRIEGNTCLCWRRLFREQPHCCFMPPSLLVVGRTFVAIAVWLGMRRPLAPRCTRTSHSPPPFPRLPLVPL